MSTTLRRSLCAAAATVMAVAGLAVAATPAQAAVSIHSVSFSNLAPVLDGDAGCGYRTQLKVTVYDPTGTAYMTADVAGPTGDTADFLYETTPAYRNGVWASFLSWVNLCGWNTPGRQRVIISVSDDDFTEATTTSYFWLRRPVSLAYNASPEPVRRGSALTHSGRLMFDPYGYGPMFGAAGQPVSIYFRANGASAYVLKGTVTTGSGGYYSRKITATGSGSWKAVYAGDAAHTSQTKRDSVTATG
jgi:hypothetical protein